MKNLNPVIFDQQNVRQKSVPRLRADDDQLKAPEALARLKGLKKDATQVSKLLPRLETADDHPTLVAGRFSFSVR